MGTSSRRTRTLLWVSPSVVLAAALLSTAEGRPEAPKAAPAKPDTAAFGAAVAPFLAAHCTKCHGDQKQAGRLSLHNLSGDVAGGRDLDRWAAVADQLRDGRMPPEGEKQPDPAAVGRVVGWIDRELAKAGKAGAVPAGSLPTGNHVPHHLLFGPAAGDIPLSAPPRLWRVSPFAHGEALKGLNRDLKLGSPFSLPAGDGFKDLAGLRIDEATAAQVIATAEAVINGQLGLGKGGRGGGKGGSGAKAAVAELAPLVGPKPATRAQVEAAVAKEFDLVLRRRPTADELARFVALHEKNVASAGPEVAARTTLTAVFLMPEAVFRYELGRGPADGSGRRPLAPRELAFAVAYALTDRAPDPALFRAADAGRLATREDVAREVGRLLDDPGTEKPRVLRFFQEYFQYRDALDVFKDPKDNKDHVAAALVADTDRLVGHVLARDKDVLRELLTTTQSFVSGPRAKKAPATSYNLPATPARQPADLPAAQRAGVLTQPSWLVAHSDNADNHAIRRGKWVRERLLGGVVPDLPIGVDAQLPNAPHKTLRERMEVTKDAACWTCHRKMNPLGLAFEMYDHFGRFRTTELKRPVDATGVVEGSGDPALDGTYPTAVAMLRKLAASDRVRQVFVRHAFRYWMGREENVGDARTLAAADEAYAKSGGSMKALITSLLTSESFLYRTVTE